MNAPALQTWTFFLSNKLGELFFSELRKWLSGMVQIRVKNNQILGFHFFPIKPSKRRCNGISVEGCKKEKVLQGAEYRLPASSCCTQCHGTVHVLGSSGKMIRHLHQLL